MLTYLRPNNNLRNNINLPNISLETKILSMIITRVNPGAYPALNNTELVKIKGTNPNKIFKVGCKE